MAGRSGQVTLELPYPVHITSVTIDHVSSLLVEQEDGSSSAPRHVRVIGYPLCPTDSKNDCAGLSFDQESPKEIVSFEYDLTGSAIQTFEADEDTQSCSDTTPSCSADSPLGFDQAEAGGSGGEFYAAALTVEVTNNWGLDEYTCLYRFRVHGDTR